MSVMNVATQKNKKDYYCIKGEWKELTKEQFQKEYNRLHPLRAKTIKFIAKLFTLSVTLAITFLLITAVYAVFNWSTGVWV